MIFKDQTLRRRKVIVRIKGGLGNQLFCYAAARRLALANDAELIIDDVTGFVRDHTYQRQYALDRFNIPARKATSRERMEPWERYRRGLAKIIARRRPFHLRHYVEQQNTDFDPRLLDLRVRGTVYLDGLWQSEGYFKDVERTIREDLRIKKPEDITNIEMAQRIQDSESVGIHVRWFEKPHHGATCNHNIGVNYYSRAVEKVSKEIKQANYFVFSDYPHEARKLLNLPDSVTCYINHNTGTENAYADLWLMALCHHFIIANSTFSWWGAWLSEYKQKVVIAPAIKQTGISAWGFEGLLPSEWNQI